MQSIVGSAFCVSWMTRWHKTGPQMRESQIEIASDIFRRWAVEHKSRGNGWKRLAIPVAPGGEQAPIVFLFGMAELSLATLHNEIPLVWIKRFGRDQTGPFEVHAIVDSKA